MENFEKCRVTIPDSRQREHVVEVSATTVYEAVGFALTAFKDAVPDWQPEMHEGVAKVEIIRPPVIHQVPVKRFYEWLITQAPASPSEQALRNKIRKMLGMPVSPNERDMKRIGQRR